MSLYFGIGFYISLNSRKGTWGTGALTRISDQLRRELPGLRGFSATSLKNMRTFFEFWQPFINRQPTADDLPQSAKINIDGLALQQWPTQMNELNREEFLGISFSHHIEILRKTTILPEVLFYIHETVFHKWDKYELRNKLKVDLYHKQGAAPNNFLQTLPARHAREAVGMFKDEYLLDFINVEEIEVNKPDDVDERVVEQAIVRNIKQFIMTFGRAFAFIGNQYHLEIFNEELFPDLCFLTVS